MGVQLIEYFLDITMEYDGNVGYKGYNKTPGATHEYSTIVSSNTRKVNKQTVDSYSQTVAPQSIVLGYYPEQVKLEGVLCQIDEVDTLLAKYAGYRTYNTLYNIFLPCSIVTCISGTIPELGDFNVDWFVDMFKIKRNLQNPSLIMYELILVRYYGSI